MIIILEAYEKIDLKYYFNIKGVMIESIKMDNVIDCMLIKCLKLFWIKMIKIYQCSKGNVYYKWKNTKKYNI